MKKILLVAAAAVGFAAVAPAFAADGTINITGSVTSNTCRVNGGTGQATINVALPTVQSTALAVAGNTAGHQPFVINLTNCPLTAKATTYFEPGANTNFTNGNLINRAPVGTAATNVEVSIYNGDMTKINLAGANNSQGSKQISVDAVTGAGTLNYFAGYTAVGAATAGAVSTNVTFTMQYQ